MLDNLPHFSQIDPATIESQFDQCLQQSLENIARLKTIEEPTWANFVKPIQAIYTGIQDFFAPISHLNSVCDTEALRTAYQQCLPKLSTFYTETAQDPDLYRCYQQLLDSNAYQSLNGSQKRWLTLTLQDLELSGVALPTDAQIRFKDIQVELADLSQQFNNQLLDATMAWQRSVKTVDQLKGIPEANLEIFAQKAKQKELDGYLLTLDMPAYQAVITYADDRNLREAIYMAYTTRASDQGPQAGDHDNTDVMEKILNRKAEAAQLLGFDNYAQNSLASKMAGTVDDVMAFLDDLAAKAKPFAIKELDALRQFAKTHLHINDLKAWDMAYVSEHYRKTHFSLSEEVIRQYFPIDKVLDGLFGIVHKLFAIRIRECFGFDSYHKDVRLFEIEKGGEVIAKFYLDLFARDNKKGGAWMADCRSRWQLPDGQLQMPVAFLTCNFRPGTDEQPALLSHTEVLTLFHEFGHGLHHMLTEVSIPGISGIAGVEWDAVELPSQFLENWCWQEDALTLISSHYQTHQPLPHDLLKAMLDARHFSQGLAMLRQIEFALFDMTIHAQAKAPDPAGIQQCLNDIRASVCLLAPPGNNRFQHGFAHIFAGGYAAGYYSYKWAEVLSSDAFSAFEQQGLFDQSTGQSFLQEILAVGASRPMSESFERFLGRKPDINALLRHSGLVAHSPGATS